MSDSKKKVKKEKPYKPALNPEARENQLINLAVNLAEQQLRDGTAPSSTVNQLLKLATEKEKLERVKAERELELITAKTENLNAARSTEELYSKAIEAMRQYAPSEDNED